MNNNFLGKQAKACLSEDARRQIKPACQSLGAGREYERQIDPIR